MSRRDRIDPDRAYDEYVDRIVTAQAECPYFETLGVVWDLDEKFCWYAMNPCEARMHCPCGKW